MSRVSVALNMANIEDEGFLDFFNELRRKQQLPKLIVDLLRFYYKDESVRAKLQDFIVKEDEFYANVSEQFTQIVEQHQKAGSNPVGVGAIQPEQLINMMMNMGMAMQKNTQPIYVQQVNPTTYPQGMQQGYPQMPMQQAPPQQMVQGQAEIGASMQIPHMEKPVQVQEEVAPETLVKHEEVKTIQPQEQPVDNESPLGLFADEDEDVEEDAPKKPASFNRFMKSIK